MIEFKTRRFSSYTDVKVLDDNVSIDLGLFDDEEAKVLAETLVETAYDIGPPIKDDADKWFAEVMKKVGIDYPSEEERDDDRIQV